MKLKVYLLLTLGLALAVATAAAQTNRTPRRLPPQPMISVQTTNNLGLVTNGPAILRWQRITQSWTNERPAPHPVLATNPYFLKLNGSQYSWTNSVFQGFLPGSLSQVIWTNFLAITNGRDLKVWSEREMPQAWTNVVVARWNTNSVIWGMKGLTALSPAWQVASASGQVPFTALTRRHAYARGHGLGAEGFHTDGAGRKVWFLTRDNVRVEAVFKRHVTHASVTNGVRLDYTIVIFDRDLPAGIDAMSVIALPDIQARYPTPVQGRWPHPIFQTEQAGYVSTGIAPLVVNTWKGGDSGSPNMIPLPGELVFFSGRSTSGPSRQMQEDMDELCRLEGLDPKRYQLHYPDLSKYPKY